MNPSQSLTIVRPKVAVVILNYNGQAFLERFLPSVLRSMYPNMDLFVADNGSTDGSLAYLKKLGFELHSSTADSPLPPDAPRSLRIPKYVIKMSENYGFAEGYNVALSQIKHADYFVLLNSDVEVAPDWIDPIIELMEKDKQIGACQPKVCMQSQPNLFEHAGAAGGWIDNWGYPFCRGRIFGALEEDKGQYNDTTEIFWASGAALFIRANLYHSIGGLDADFFAHMEEIDLCWRLKRANYKVMVCPLSQVWHVGGGTLPATNPRKDYLNFRNSLATLLKNKESIGQAIFAIGLRLILDGVAGLQLLLKGKPKNVWAIVRAHWSFFGSIPKNIKKRTAAQKRIANCAYQGKPVFRQEGLYKGSIVWQHFIKRTSTFSALKIK